MTTASSASAAPVPQTTTEDRIIQLEKAAEAHKQQIEYMANLLFAIAGNFFPTQTAAARTVLGVAEDIFSGLGKL